MRVLVVLDGVGIDVVRGARSQSGAMVAIREGEISSHFPIGTFSASHRLQRNSCQSTPSQLFPHLVVIVLIERLCM